MRARHPETQLTVFEIPQIPGYRHGSHSIKGIDESFVTTVYAIPIAMMNPYLAGGLFVDYLVRGRYHLIPKNPDSGAGQFIRVDSAGRDPREFAPVQVYRLRALQQRIPTSSGLRRNADGRESQSGPERNRVLQMSKRSRKISRTMDGSIRRTTSS